MWDGYLRLKGSMESFKQKLVGLETTLSAAILRSEERMTALNIPLMAANEGSKHDQVVPLRLEKQRTRKGKNYNRLGAPCRANFKDAHLWKTHKKKREKKKCKFPWIWEYWHEN